MNSYPSSKQRLGIYKSLVWCGVIKHHTSGSCSKHRHINFIEGVVFFFFATRGHVCVSNYGGTLTSMQDTMKYNHNLGT